MAVIWEGDMSDYGLPPVKSQYDPMKDPRKQFIAKFVKYWFGITYEEPVITYWV